MTYVRQIYHNFEDRISIAVWTPSYHQNVTKISRDLLSSGIIFPMNHSFYSILIIIDSTIMLYLHVVTTNIFFYQAGKVKMVFQSVINLMLVYNLHKLKLFYNHYDKFKNEDY
jgi:hypothetical protein